MMVRIFDGSIHKTPARIIHESSAETVDRGMSFFVER